LPPNTLSAGVPRLYQRLNDPAYGIPLSTNVDDRRFDDQRGAMQAAIQDAARLLAGQIAMVTTVYSNLIRSYFAPSPSTITDSFERPSTVATPPLPMPMNDGMQRLMIGLQPFSPNVLPLQPGPYYTPPQ
jgi:hypothetical protein